MSDTIPLAKRVGEAIRILRNERKMSQQRLADSMGTARSYLSKLERGLIDPSLSTLERAARALRLDVPEVFLRVRNRILELVGE